MNQTMRLLKHIATLVMALSLCGTRAMADVVTVVSAKSPMTTLTKSQVTNIFLGKTSRFPDGTLAVPVDQADGASVRDEFYATVAGKSAEQMKAHWSKIIFTGRGHPPREETANSDVKKFLLSNPAAIGYIDKSALDANVKALTILP